MEEGEKMGSKEARIEGGAGGVVMTEDVKEEREARSKSHDNITVDTMRQSVRYAPRDAEIGSQCIG